MNKTISVALCTYNGEKFIEQQLESIFAQSMPVHEIIVCDDCSTDNTIAIINRISQNHPGIIQVHINEVNLRSVKNFEKAISLTTGDYIFLSDQDDLWHKEKVRTIIDFFTANPKAEGVFTNASLINDDGDEFCNYTLWNLAMFSYDMIARFKRLWEIYKINQNMVTGATLCFTKNVKEFIFPFPITIYFHHDEWIALHLAQRDSLFALEDKLTLYRIHTDQQVGELMLKRYENERAFSDWALGFTTPPSFSKYLKLFKRSYVIHLKFISLKKSMDNKVLDINDLIQGSINNFHSIAAKMRKSYPVRFFFKRAHDKMRNKRQLPKKYSNA